MTPLDGALEKRSKMLIVVLSSFPRAVRATYGVGGSRPLPVTSLAAVRVVWPICRDVPDEQGPCARFAEPSHGKGIPCHDAPVTFGAHVTCDDKCVGANRVWAGCVACLVSLGCVLGSRLPSGMGRVGIFPMSRTLLPVMQCAIEGLTIQLSGPDSFVLDGRV